jgi:hypothetical protein
LQQISELRMHASVALAPCVLPRFNAPSTSKAHGLWHCGRRIRSPAVFKLSGRCLGAGRVVSAAGFRRLISLLQEFQHVWCDLSAHGLASATRKPCLTKRFPLTSPMRDRVGVRTFLTRPFPALHGSYEGTEYLRAAGTVTPPPEIRILF